jgi:hypothetical protein
MTSITNSVCHNERCGRGTNYGIDEFLSVEVDALRERLQISRTKKSGERIEQWERRHDQSRYGAQRKATNNQHKQSEQQ